MVSDTKLTTLTESSSKRPTPKSWTRNKWDQGLHTLWNNKKFENFKHLSLK